MNKKLISNQESEKMVIIIEGGSGLVCFNKECELYNQEVKPHYHEGQRLCPCCMKKIYQLSLEQMMKRDMDKFFVKNRYEYEVNRKSENTNH